MSAVRELIEGIERYKGIAIKMNDTFYDYPSLRTLHNKQLAEAEQQITQAIRDIAGKCWTHNDKGE